jgi:hypothetical protein
MSPLRYWLLLVKAILCLGLLYILAFCRAKQKRDEIWKDREGVRLLGCSMKQGEEIEGNRCFFLVLHKVSSVGLANWWTACLML